MARLTTQDGVIYGCVRTAGREFGKDIVKDKRNVTCLSDDIKDRVMKDVVKLKAPISVIAQLHCIPETTVNMWARAAGLMKDRPFYAKPRRGYFMSNKSQVREKQLKDLIHLWAKKRPKGMAEFIREDSWNKMLKYHK